MAKLTKVQRHKIMQKARRSQLRTMATAAYKRAAAKGASALNAWRKANATA